MAVPAGAVSTSYSYDALGRVVAVTYPNGRTARYKYDKAGNRIEKSVTGTGNAAPVAVDDILTASTATAADISPLTNDSDPDNDTLSVTAVSDPDHGTATRAGNVVTYTSDSGYTGSDSFTYEIADGHGGTDTATINVTVSAASGQQPYNATHTPWAVAASGTSTVNAVNFDIGGEGISWHDNPGLDNPSQTLRTDTDVEISQGNASIGWVNGGEWVEYTINVAEAGTYAFKMSSATPGDGAYATATFEKNGSVYANTGAKLLPNTGDWTTFVDGSPTIVTLQAGVQVVRVTFSGNGADLASFSLTPSAPASNLLVNGSFEDIAISSGQNFDYDSVPGWTAISGGKIELWNAIIGLNAPDGVIFGEMDDGTAWDGFYQNVQTTNGQTYTFSIDLLARPGSPLSTQGVEILWNNTVVSAVTPTANWAAYTVTVAGTGGSDRVTVREVQSQSGDGYGAIFDNAKLTVATGNAAPAANTDTITTAYNTAKTFDPRANDADANGDSLTVTAVGSAAHGTTGHTGTSITYTPTSGYSGADSFTYTLSDGHGGTATGVVNVTVGSADGNLLVNGSFEDIAISSGQNFDYDVVPGWTAISGGKIELWNAIIGLNAPDGVIFGEMDDWTAWDGFYQNVQTTSGQAYTFSIELLARPGSPLSTQDVEILWNNTVVSTITPAASWATYSVTVTGTGGSDRVTVREVQSQSGDGYGAIFDNAKLIPDAPSTPTINVTSSANLRSLANANGYTGTSGAHFDFVVPSGTTISGSAGNSGTATGGNAIDTGSWPSGSVLRLIVNGTVYGGGGAGGTADCNAGSGAGGGNGGNGGAGVWVNAPITITVNGTLKGGGGGGAGANVYQENNHNNCGGGGGGGAPNADGGSPGGGSGSGGSGGGGGLGDDPYLGTTSGGNGGAPGSDGGSAGGWAGGGTGGHAGESVHANGHSVTINGSGTY